STEIRAQWAKNRGYLVNEESFSEEQKLLIEKNDITLGMNQKAVMESWGDPDVIEVAGDPIYGNERWQYSKYVSATEGFQKQIKVVYFESGHVVGWESN
ncbi:MAG: hypothetical protein K1X29_11505, partial [Bdellovibrionales bacterium]|nr:hypothetical protein [Bdellovibrionales bacterium]